MVEYYHNSSFLEFGGSPDNAVKSALVSQIDAYLKQSGKYTKSDAKIKFQDIADCLVLVSSSFSTLQPSFFKLSFSICCKHHITVVFKILLQFLRSF